MCEYLKNAKPGMIVGKERWAGNEQIVIGVPGIIGHSGAPEDDYEICCLFSLSSGELNYAYNCPIDISKKSVYEGLQVENGFQGKFIVNKLRFICINDKWSIEIGVCEKSDNSSNFYNWYSLSKFWQEFNLPKRRKMKISEICRELGYEVEIIPEEEPCT